MDENQQAELMSMQLIDGYQNEGQAAQLFDDLIARLENRTKTLGRAMNRKHILSADIIYGLLRTAKIVRERCLRAAAEQQQRTRAMEYRKQAALASYYFLESMKLASSLSMNKLPDYLARFEKGFGREDRDILRSFQKKWDKMSAEHWKEIGKKHGIEIKEVQPFSDTEDSWELWEKEKAPAKTSAGTETPGKRRTAAETPGKETPAKETPGAGHAG